jgi:four helix bundle protein
MEKPLQRHFGLADQIRRAAISIPGNIAEGYGLGTDRQFVRCLRIALGSTYELVGHIEMAREMALVDSELDRKLQEDCEVLIKLLVGLLKKLARRD